MGLLTVTVSSVSNFNQHGWFGFCEETERNRLQIMVTSYIYIYIISYNLFRSLCTLSCKQFAAKIRCQQRWHPNWGHFPTLSGNLFCPKLHSCCHNLLQSSPFHQRYQLGVALDIHKVTPTCSLRRLLHLTRISPDSNNNLAIPSKHVQLGKLQRPNTRMCNTTLHGLHQGKFCRKHLRRVDRTDGRNLHKSSDQDRGL